MSEAVPLIMAQNWPRGSQIAVKEKLPCFHKSFKIALASVDLEEIMGNDRHSSPPNFSVLSLTYKHPSLVLL